MRQIVARAGSTREEGKRGRILLHPSLGVWGSMGSETARKDGYFLGAYL